MNSLFLIFLFTFGIAFGSFLGVVIDRLPKKKSVITGRSHCDYCKHTLAWYDLIPLFSFLLLGGKCRYCKRFIGWSVFWIEVLTGLSFVFVGSYVSSMYYVLSIMGIVSLVFYFATMCSLIAIFFIDLQVGIIPDNILFPLTIVTFLYILLTTNYLLPNILSAIVSFLFFLLLFIGTKGKGMGFGDVKYVFFMGLFLGWPKILIGMYAAFLTGAVISLILVICRKKKFLGGTIPFGPFLVFGTIFALFFGNLLWQKFLTFL